MSNPTVLVAIVAAISAVVGALVSGFWAARSARETANADDPKVALEGWKTLYEATQKQIELLRVEVRELRDAHARTSREHQMAIGYCHTLRQQIVDLNGVAANPPIGLII